MILTDRHAIITCLSRAIYNLYLSPPQRLPPVFQKEEREFISSISSKHKTEHADVDYWSAVILIRRRLVTLTQASKTCKRKFSSIHNAVLIHIVLKVCSRKSGYKSQEDFGLE